MEQGPDHWTKATAETQTCLGDPYPVTVGQSKQRSWLDEIAAKHGAMPGQVAMAWLMARPSVCAPIASATKLSQLDELLKSVDLLLDADDIARLDVASA